MIRKGLAMLALALAAGVAQAAPSGSCDDMVAKFDAYLKAHPNATGALPQSVDAQLTYQPSRESLEKAEKEGRAHLYDLLAKAKTQQSAGDESGCRATLTEVQWMLQP
jgi:hypothetical protein